MHVGSIPTPFLKTILFYFSVSKTFGVKIKSLFKKKLCARLIGKKSKMSGMGWPKSVKLLS